MEYSNRIAEILRESRHKPVGPQLGALAPYEPLAVDTPAGASFLAYFLVGWTPKMRLEEDAWKAMIANFQASLQLMHPSVALASTQIELEDGRYFPLYMSQAYAKMRRSVRGNIAFMDFDIVAYNRCDPFEDDFDVGLTDCEDLWPMQPFNAGVQFYRDTPAAQEYLDLVMEMTCCIPGNMDPWYCQQISMGTAYHMLKDRVKFKIFDHTEWNYTPPGSMYVPTDAYFVHARGQRKNLHQVYIAELIKREKAA